MDRSVFGNGVPIRLAKSSSCARLVASGGDQASNQSFRCAAPGHRFKSSRSRKQPCLFLEKVASVRNLALEVKPTPRWAAGTSRLSENSWNSAA
jgi:hypothetical protein